MCISLSLSLSSQLLCAIFHQFNARSNSDWDDWDECFECEWKMDYLFLTEKTINLRIIFDWHVSYTGTARVHSVLLHTHTRAAQAQALAPTFRTTLSIHIEIKSMGVTRVIWRAICSRWYSKQQRQPKSVFLTSSCENEKQMKKIIIMFIV